MSTDDIEAPNDYSEHRSRRVVACAVSSFIVTVALFVVDYPHCRFVSLDPQRSLHNSWASLSQLVFFGGAYFIAVTWIPTWPFSFLAFYLVTSIRRPRKTRTTILNA